MSLLTDLAAAAGALGTLVKDNVPGKTEAPVAQTPAELDKTIEEDMKDVKQVDGDLAPVEAVDEPTVAVEEVVAEIKPEDVVVDEKTADDLKSSLSNIVDKAKDFLNGDKPFDEFLKDTIVGEIELGLGQTEWAKEQNNLSNRDSVFNGSGKP